MADTQAPSPLHQDYSIVFLGSFNPQIFHPTWFERAGLVTSEEEAKILNDAKHHNLVVTPDVSRCEIGDDITIECLSERLIINAATSLVEERIKTIAYGILEKLPHTPIRAIGLNYNQVFGSRDIDEWHLIGDILAPKDKIWSKVMTSRPGMSLLRMEDLIPGPPPVRVWSTIEPIGEKHPPYRFSIKTNWHTNLPAEHGDQAQMASEFIQSQWGAALTFGKSLAETIFDQLLSAKQ